MSPSKGARSSRRASRNGAQQALADSVGLTGQTINAIEQGKYSPTLEAAFRIARSLGANLEEAFSYEDSDTD